MPMLPEDVAGQLKEEFVNLVNPVRLAVFSQALSDPGSEQVKRLVEEVAALSDKLSIESYNFVLDAEKVATLGIARIPAIAVLGAESDPGIRFYGPPSGYEFGSLIDAIVEVSRGQSELAPETVAELAALQNPVHLQVFSTPT
ncbi:MAG: hypothetical protein NDJ94_17410 [Vicinamibacteria bacterium]|jgi:alkyl hydroperoxide reductase subunit AhpF|nr:hypothetical protein [Vicinamibacteria bacterium]